MWICNQNFDENLEIHYFISKIFINLQELIALKLCAENH